MTDKYLTQNDDTWRQLNALAMVTLQNMYKTAFCPNQKIWFWQNSLFIV